MLELELLARARQEDIQREFKRQQLIRAAIRPRSPFRSAISGISRSLCRLGAWLERRMGESAAAVVSQPIQTARR